MNEERLEVLMVKVVDDVATPAERQELMTTLSADPALRQEYEVHLALKATTDGLVERLEVDLISDRYHESPLVTAETTLGWLLFFCGLALVMGYVVYHFLSTPDIPLAIRLGIAGMASGGLVLMASAIRARLSTRGHDRYSEVIR